MAFTIDINCDMGEGMGNEAAIMPYISSANISCGYHAGDEHDIRTAMRLAKQFGVAVGAHPSFKDRENFGRIQHHLNEAAIYTLIREQLEGFTKIAQEENIVVQHVKPHGALYNWSAANEAVAKTIARAVKDFDCNLMLFGLSGSFSISAAAFMGLKTVSEVFADRTYQPDGNLTPRSQPGAVIEDEEQMLQQVLQMVQQKTVKSSDGSVVSIQAETICIHGDGLHVVNIAEKIYHTLQKNQVGIQSFKNKK